jgi:molybdopterin-dependent oxidoreductase-like protein protein/phosphatidylethanolamine-binding protein
VTEIAASARWQAPPGRAVPVVDPGLAYQQALGAGLIVHRADPLNAETPLSALAGTLVPRGRHYIRNHFRIPALDAAGWRLRVGGLVGRTLSLSLADLRSRDSHTAVVTLECAGNGRSGLDPSVPGEQWGLGAVGTAQWTGVPLTEVLERAAPPASAREVVFRVADRGRVEGRDGQVRFERSLDLGQLRSAGGTAGVRGDGAAHAGRRSRVGCRHQRDDDRRGTAAGDGPHHYVFRLLAVDTPVQLRGLPSYQDVEAAVTGHILGEARLTGMYQR